MILTILSVILLAVGIVCMIIGDKSYREWLEYVGAFLMVICATAVLLCLAFILHARIEKEAEIEIKRSEYETLTYELEKFNSEDYSLTSSINFDLFPRIAEYNSDIRASKYYTESLWINWFCIDYYNYLPTIDLS